MGVLVLFQSNTHTVITSRCLDTQVQLILVHDLLIRAIPGHHLAKDTQVEHHHQDKTLRLWDLSTGKTTRRFEDHTKDVLSVAFSADNRQIVSASRDKTIKLWNTLAQCKLKTNHIGHTGYLNTVTLSPDGSLCASGGKDGKAMLWDLNDGKHLYTLDNTDTINALTFSPNRYWLCSATGPTIKVWDLESKNLVEELRPEVPGSARAEPPQCLSLAWSADGQTLFAGYSDNLIRVWQLSQVGSR